MAIHDIQADIEGCFRRVSRRRGCSWVAGPRDSGLNTADLFCALLEPRCDIIRRGNLAGAILQSSICEQKIVAKAEGEAETARQERADTAHSRLLQCVDAGSVPLLFDEGQEIGVERFGIGGEHAMRIAGIKL